MSDIKFGICKFYLDLKGYGFINIDGTDQDIFVHARDLERSGISTLESGDKVSFVIGTDERRGRTLARDIRLIPQV
jgi:cold shock protein